MYTYILEVWNPIRRRYEKCGEWNDMHRAEIMFDKPYNQRHTRRLIRLQTEILFQEKAGHYKRK